MKKIVKKAVATICIGAMTLCVLPCAAMAETLTIDSTQQIKTEVSPRMQYIRDILCVLNFSGTTAIVEASTEGYANRATKAKVIAELQIESSPGNWLPVKIWTVTENDFRAEVYETHTINPNNTYRVKVTATVWEGSLSETKIVYND